MGDKKVMFNRFLEREAKEKNSSDDNKINLEEDINNNKNNCDNDNNNNNNPSEKTYKSYGRKNGRTYTGKDASLKGENNTTSNNNDTVTDLEADTEIQEEKDIYYATDIEPNVEIQREEHIDYNTDRKIDTQRDKDTGKHTSLKTNIIKIKDIFNNKYQVPTTYYITSNNIKAENTTINNITAENITANNGTVTNPTFYASKTPSLNYPTAHSTIFSNYYATNDNIASNDISVYSSPYNDITSNNTINNTNNNSLMSDKTTNTPTSNTTNNNEDYENIGEVHVYENDTPGKGFAQKGKKTPEAKGGWNKKINKSSENIRKATSYSFTDKRKKSWRDMLCCCCPKKSVGVEENEE